MLLWFFPVFRVEYAASASNHWACNRFGDFGT
ncbi:hypothetical protein SAMN05444959_105245 [Paracoccus seriniphilus]|uniref:Uncharacterized protein n=1 Tax=Paracoccus seriniphilus TaxID=184748 RepID=A0A239PU21_9RHOB|nr:hypothetical protein SAMN05444959_105245 [Paracoccus seriniphilus]